MVRFGKAMEFARLGGLSPVKYDTRTNFSGHQAPVAHGIWAFPWPYIEQFLCLYDEEHENELKRQGFRRFRFDGSLYHHLQEPPPEGFWDVQGWTLSNIEEYSDLLQKFKRQAIRELDKNRRTCQGPYPDVPVIGDPFKRGQGGVMARDQLEVFIPKTEMGRIR